MIEGRRLDVVGAGVSAGLALVLAIWQLRPWRSDLAVPFDYTGDAPQTLMLIKGILEHGWFWRNPDVGAPGGQELLDFPMLNGDVLHVLVIKLLGFLGFGASEVMNLFFLLTFPLVAVTAYLVMRELGLSPATGVVCSVLYALLPYHFLRGESHLWLSAYYAVPIGAYLTLAVLGERPLFGGRRRSLVTIGLCAVVAFASGSFYYPAFTVLLVAAATLFRFVLSRDRRALVAGGAVCAAIVGFCLVALAPSAVHWLRHGTNPEVAKRFPLESELYSVKLAQLVLPSERHRLGPLARARERYYEWSPPADTRPAALGVVAAVGFLWLLGVAMLSILRAGFLSDLERHAAFASLVALLVATNGGFSTLIGAVWPQLRAWNRLSIFIAFFALLAVGLLLERLRPRPRIFAAALAAVFAVGVFDQTSPKLIPPHETLAAEWESDEEFVRGIERRLPGGAMVFQLPHLTFPEANGPSAMGSYDPVRGYIHSDDLRWSFGAMRGRPEDRFAFVAERTVAQGLPAVVSAGFAGIWVDRYGWDDRGAETERYLRTVFGPPALVSENERFSFFEVRPDGDER